MQLKNLPVSLTAMHFYSEKERREMSEQLTIFARMHSEVCSISYPVSEGHFGCVSIGRVRDPR